MDCGLCPYHLSIIRTLYSVHANEKLPLKQAKADAAGATITTPAEDTFWVMRYGRLKDPYGYVWALSAPLPLTPP